MNFDFSLHSIGDTCVVLMEYILEFLLAEYDDLAM